MLLHICKIRGLVSAFFYTVTPGDDTMVVDLILGMK